MPFQTVDAQRPWSALIGYSRAVRVGNMIVVGGTSATLSTGEVVAPGSAYEQTRHILEVIVEAIAELGGAVEDIVRTRAYLTNIDDWEKVGKAHGEFFIPTRPAYAFVEVSRLLLPRLVVEIEATAIVGGRESL